MFESRWIKVEEDWVAKFTGHSRPHVSVLKAATHPGGWKRPALPDSFVFLGHKGHSGGLMELNLEGTRSEAESCPDARIIIRKSENRRGNGKERWMQNMVEEAEARRQGRVSLGFLHWVSV